MSKNHLIQRDISWLSFNARVLQEANDATVPLRERIRFLGIFSNNLTLAGAAILIEEPPTI